jgi:hypothetical protein
MGNTPQEKAHGRQIVGRRLPLSSRGSTSRQASPRRVSKWIIVGGSLASSILTLDPGLHVETTHTAEDCDRPVAFTRLGLEWKLLEREIARA